MEFVASSQVMRTRPSKTSSMPAPAGPRTPPAPGAPGAPGAATESALVGQTGVAGAWTFAAGGRFRQHRWDPGARSITVCYLDRPPLDVAAPLGALVTSTPSTQARVVFAGPFETITPWRWDWFDGHA